MGPVTIGADGDLRMSLDVMDKEVNFEDIHRCPNGDVAACEFCKLLNVFSIISRTFKLR
jgi:hypothetical protein